LDIEQRPAPAGPQAAESDPKYSIEGRQNGSLTFSLEGGELQPQGSIFDCDGLVTAQQESDESKDKQEKGWHVTPIVRPQFIPSQSATSGRNNGERQSES
jgi:hypothetical protein